MRQLLRDDAIEYLGCSKRTLDRMIERGELTPTGKGKNALYPMKQLKLAVSDLAKRQGKHRPTDHPEHIPEKQPEKPVETRDLIFEMREKPEDLLNEIGKSELLRVTDMLRTADLLDITDPMLIMKYALCQQMFFKYMSVSDSEEELKVVSLGTTTSPYFKMMESYQRQAAFYEKELGLTTAARVKMKLPEAQPPRDEMEDILES